MDDNVNGDPIFGEVTDSTEAPGTGSATNANTPDPPSPEARRIGELAVNLRDNAAAGWLYMVTNSTLGEKIGPDAFLVFRKLMLEEAGEPADPVERMLLEQLALAHFSIGQLRIRACTSDLPKLALAFSDSATRLLGEFRRCSLALEEYRSKRAIRTERRAPSTAREKVSQARLSLNGNGKHAHTKVGSSDSGIHRHSEAHGNGGMPKWLKQRMASPTPNGSPPAAATAANGKG